MKSNKVKVNFYILPILLIISLAPIKIIFDKYHKYKEDLELAAKELESQDAMCQKQLFQKAIEYESSKHFEAARIIYDHLCNWSSIISPDSSQHPCNSGGRLSKLIGNSYNEVMSKLAKHYTTYGTYPENLKNILDEMIPSYREIAEKFIYCNKHYPQNPQHPCSNLKYDESGISLIGHRSGVSKIFGFKKSVMNQNSQSLNCVYLANYLTILGTTIDP